MLLLFSIIRFSSSLSWLMKLNKENESCFSKGAALLTWWLCGSALVWFLLSPPPHTGQPLRGVLERNGLYS